MAYAFAATSSQYLSTSSTPVTNVPVTHSIMFRANQTNAAQAVLAVNNGSNDRIVVSITTSAKIAYATGTSSAAALAESPGTYQANVWGVASGKSGTSSSRFAYFNGSGSENTQSLSVGSLDVIYVGTRFVGSLGAFFNGQAAEAALWNVTLTDAEIASLAKGFKPYRIRPQSLVFYAPLIRTLQDTKGGLAITNNNSATVADHPRVY